MTDELLETRRRARRAFAILCLWIPLGVFGVIAAVQLALLPLLPETVATHWSLSGTADGFGPAWTYPLMTVGIGGGITALIAGISLAEMKSTAQRTQYRFLGTVIGAETGFLGSTMLGLVIVQVGLDDASSAPGTLGVLILSLVVGGVLGTIYLFVIEEPPATDVVDKDPRLLPDAEQSVWSRSVRMSRAGAVTLGTLLGVTTIGVLALCFDAVRRTGSVPFALWGTLALILAVSVLSLSMMRFDVRVDDAGLTVRAPLGWPRAHIATDSITSASAVEVSPMAEFGGWGWRFGANGQGFVLRAGEGIRIARDGGSDLTITVDDATTAAALLRRNIARD